MAAAQTQQVGRATERRASRLGAEGKERSGAVLFLQPDSSGSWYIPFHRSIRLSAISIEHQKKWN
jgi:hypothetical protein